MPAATPQELLASLRDFAGEARFRFARENIEMLLQSSKPAHVLGYLTDRDTFEDCFDLPDYCSFVIELTTRLIQIYRAIGLKVGLGLEIEECLNTIARSQRASEEFVDFCKRFGETIQGFILGVDSDFGNVVLPMQDRNEKNPGILALRTIIAKTLLRRCGPIEWREVALMMGASTGGIGIEPLKDFMGEIRSLDDFIFKAILGYYLANTRENSERSVREIALMEEATRSRVRQWK
jgi:hypothetical protein